MYVVMKLWHLGASCQEQSLTVFWDHFAHQQTVISCHLLNKPLKVPSEKIWYMYIHSYSVLYPYLNLLRS